MVTILAIDGGGIRGIIPATILAEIEKRTGKPICELFDIIAGSSTGGIITALLTVADEEGKPKYTAEEVEQYYINFGQTVFHRSFLRKIVTLDGLIGPKYSARPLERYLQKYLGNAQLHATLTNVLIPAYNMESSTPWFFKTTNAVEGSSPVDNPPLAGVARATSAAPTYFPPCRMGAEHCFIDGGVFAGNPVLCAYAQVMKHFPKERDFVILSLGTGEHQVCHTYRQIKQWGTLKWAVPIFGVISNSSSATVDYQMKALVGTDQYFRFQVRLGDEAGEMDDASEENIKRLEMLAKQEIRHNSEKIEYLCEKLLKSRRRKATDK